MGYTFLKLRAQRVSSWEICSVPRLGKFAASPVLVKSYRRDHSCFCEKRQWFARELSGDLDEPFSGRRAEILGYGLRNTGRNRLIRYMDAQQRDSLQEREWTNINRQCLEGRDIEYLQGRNTI